MMRFGPFRIAAAFVLLILTPLLQAQSVATDAVGFVKQTIPPNSDSLLSAPLKPSAAFTGVIQSISGNVMTVSGMPNWTTSPKQFVYAAGTQAKTYFVQIGSGTKAGLVLPVTDNSSSTLTVDLSGLENLSGVKTVAVDGSANADKILVTPYWTPSTLYPSTWPSGTQLLLFNTTLGTNIAASKILVYSGSQWIDLSTSQSANDLILDPDEGFIVRNNSASSIDYVDTGSVPYVRHRTYIQTLAANRAQDNLLSYTSPVPEVLGTTSLGVSAGDQLLIFDNSAMGKNKAASKILVYSGSRWIDLSNSADVTDTFSLLPAQGFIYRKAATASAQTFVWADQQSYNTN